MYVIYIYIFFFSVALAVLKLLHLEELLEESEDYKFGYQDLSVKSLLSKVSVLCDTSKNSYLGDSFGFNENTSAADYSKSTNILPNDDVADIFKKPLPLKHVHSATKSIELVKEINISPEKHSFSENDNKMPRLNNIEILDEVSTMSDLVNTFCDEKLQPENVTSGKPGQKRTTADIVAINNKAVDQDLESMAMEIDFENEVTPELNLQPQAKIPCIEKPTSKLQSFKQAKSTQSSQSAFKRVFSSFVAAIDAEDLDDPIFQM